MLHHMKGVDEGARFRSGYEEKNKGVKAGRSRATGGLLGALSRNKGRKGFCVTGST